MYKIISCLIFVLLAAQNSIAQTREVARCGNEFDVAELTDNDLLRNNRVSATNGTVYRIPVVFHVLTNQAGSVSDISNCIIENQIQILNNCFRKKTGAPNTNQAGVDAEIEFYLAKKNNAGDSFNGINRVVTQNCDYTTVNSSSQIRAIRAAAGISSNWPINKYLNIIVLRTMPNNNKVRGQAWYGGTNMGVLVHYSYVGSKNSGCSKIDYLDITGFKAYDLGMTVVHEVGHYLNLKHTFDNCIPGDGCSDTPPVSGVPNAQCGSDNDIKGLCSGATSRMWQNYLDYTDDACMDRFTACQVQRMRTVLESISDYKNLVSQNNFIATGGDIATSLNESAILSVEEVKIFPNPFVGEFRILTKCNNSIRLPYRVINLFGQEVKRGQINSNAEMVKLNQLPAGVYFLKLQKRSFKLVKE